MMMAAIAVEKSVEVRWHGRAQQGVVTAAKVLGEAALMEGKYVQAFPEFGPERMGAPVKAYNRISNSPIRIHSQVKSPSIVLIADPTLIGMQLSGGLESSASVTDGVSEKGVFIVNSPLSPEAMRTKLGLKAGFAGVYTIDASKISMEALRRHLPNAALLGALVKITEIVKLDSLLDNFKENYSKKFSPEVIEGNIKAMKRGFEEVKGE